MPLFHAQESSPGPCEPRRVARVYYEAVELLDRLAGILTEASGRSRELVALLRSAQDSATASALADYLEAESRTVEEIRRGLDSLRPDLQPGQPPGIPAPSPAPGLRGQALPGMVLELQRLLGEAARLAGHTAGLLAELEWCLMGSPGHLASTYAQHLRGLAQALERAHLLVASWRV